MKTKEYKHCIETNNINSIGQWRTTMMTTTTMKKKLQMVQMWCTRRKCCTFMHTQNIASCRQSINFKTFFMSFELKCSCFFSNALTNTNTHMCVRAYMHACVSEWVEFCNKHTYGLKLESFFFSRFGSVPFFSLVILSVHFGILSH